MVAIHLLHPPVMTTMDVAQDALLSMTIADSPTTTTIGGMHRRLHIHDQTTMTDQEDPLETTDANILATIVDLQIIFATLVRNHTTPWHIVWLKLMRMFKMQIPRLQQLV
mmetsp:Transcript_42251/g.62132  ORF Transcript_42251/g.62132 Transcript_42251/m.62132 type:complete len:110 (-) Transcript_42251:148-477(-)